MIRIKPVMQEMKLVNLMEMQCKPLIQKDIGMQKKIRNSLNLLNNMGQKIGKKLHLTWICVRMFNACIDGKKS
jgi:hypothetical protein